MLKRPVTKPQHIIVGAVERFLIRLYAFPFFRPFRGIPFASGGGEIAIEGVSLPLRKGSVAVALTAR